MVKNGIRCDFKMYSFFQTCRAVRDFWLPKIHFWILLPQDSMEHVRFSEFNWQKQEIVNVSKKYLRSIKDVHEFSKSVYIKVSTNMKGRSFDFSQSWKKNFQTFFFAYKKPDLFLQTAISSLAMRRCLPVTLSSTVPTVFASWQAIHERRLCKKAALVNSYMDRIRMKPEKRTLQTRFLTKPNSSWRFNCTKKEVWNLWYLASIWCIWADIGTFLIKLINLN